MPNHASRFAWSGGRGAAVAATLCVMAAISCNAMWGIDELSYDGGGGAPPDLPLGDPCQVADDCVSGFCVDEVCCESPCQGSCEGCNADGSEGACEPHAVGTDRDDECPEGGSCDRNGTCVSGAHIWSRRFGGPDSQVIQAMALDSSGNVIVVGHFRGTLDIGGPNGPFTSAGGEDLFVAKLDPQGEPLWSRAFGDETSQYASAVAVSPADDIIVVGAINGTVDFGGGPLISAGGGDAYVAIFDPQGVHRYSTHYGDTLGQWAQGVAVDPLGDIVMVGNMDGTMDFGVDVLTSAGSQDAFVAKLSSTGDPLWALNEGDDDGQQALAVATDSAGNIALTGWMRGGMNWGTVVLQGAGTEDVFIAKLHPDGETEWAHQAGDLNSQKGYAIGMDDGGNVLVAGTFAGSLQLDGGDTELYSAGVDDAFVLSFTPSGVLQWGRPLGDDSPDQEARGLAVDGSGNVFVTGYFKGTLDLGTPDGPIRSAGYDDVFVVKLDADGTPLWGRQSGDMGPNQQGRAAAVDGAGNVLAAGRFDGALDFGGPTLLSEGAADSFVVKLGP